MLTSILARRLLELRERMNLTQEAAAELCDLSPRYWGKLERCQATASLDTLDKISEGLNVGIRELLEPLGYEAGPSEETDAHEDI